MARKNPWRWPNRPTRPIVIFVDDDKEFTDGFCHDLEAHYDYEMWPCYNTRDALGRAQQLGPLVNAVVLDMRIGVDDGIKVAEMMLARCEHAKVLYISGDHTALENLGGAPGLMKPFKIEDLDNALKALVSGNGA